LTLAELAAFPEFRRRVQQFVDGGLAGHGCGNGFVCELGVIRFEPTRHRPRRRCSATDATKPGQEVPGIPFQDNQAVGNS
jgi:hypothetical protein